MFLLDTDHVVIAQQQTQPQYDHLVAQVRQYPKTDFYVSIVSFHEQVMGWNAYLSRAKKAADVVRGYARLGQMLANFCEAQIAAFDEAAAATFVDLRKRRVRIGTMDLRIAAIALSRGMTVLTRNLHDFRRVPRLAAEDWSVPTGAG
jgi:tRNA(fMet)-specific endonuclease VapC